MSDKSYVVINRGTKTFHLKDGPKGEKRELGPGKSIECLDETEYKALMNYFREIVDADKVVPANAARVDDLKAQIAKLEADNARLTRGSVAEEEPAEKPTHSKKKGH